MANRYGYITNVNHIIGTNGKTVPVSSINPFPVDNSAGSTGEILSGNSRNTNLTAGQPFVGATTDVLKYSSIVISLNSDVESADGGLSIQFSIDGSDWHETDAYTYNQPTVFKTWTIQRVAQYFRVVYTNGSTDQTHFELSTIGNPVSGVASSHRVGDIISNEDDAQLTKAVLSGMTPLGDQVNIHATPDGSLRTDVVTPVGSLPVSQLTTLFDGKTLNRLFPEMFEAVGTGTGTFQTNKYNMAVTSGQYEIYQSRRFLPYYSGKPQKVELTFDNFAPETNVIKRAGYFSSNTSAPYNSTLDGFFLESSGGTITFNIFNNGSTIVSTDITNWTGYDLLNGYQTLSNWDNFTVIEFNFLWLGGAYIELRLVTSEGFTTVHKLVYAGTAQDVFLQSPNQPVRYEIRSSTGSGNFRAICSQVATSGSVNESAFNRSQNTGHVAITYPTVGTKYPLIAIRKGATYRDNPIKIVMADILVSSSDIVRWTLEINPTLSGALTYNAEPNSGAEIAIGSSATTVTTTGIRVASGYLVQNGRIQPEVFESNFLSWLSGSITGTQDQYIFTVTPTSPNINVFGQITWGEG